MTHKIYYDATCPMCQKTVRRIRERDEKGRFEYIPLDSDRARSVLSPELLKGDTIVLIEENGKIWLRSKAVFRILKFLGGKGSWLGFLVYVPGLDLFYRMIAHNRHLFR
ncbi:MAG: hypothetical protein KR126chlam1_00056 [Chlamydiae bacterium]|nr:hypothetical protein [Chlamydiota bacterium]